MSKKNRKKIIFIILLIVVIYNLYTQIYLKDKTSVNNVPVNEINQIQEFSDLAELEYTGDITYIVNNNVPFFTEEEKSITKSFEEYKELDNLGRTVQGFAYLTKENQTDEERESLQGVTPTGYIQNRYEEVSGSYLYNRCHLLAFALSGEQDNEENLITCTRSANVEGMLPYEEQLMDYIDEGGEVLYRVTPVYEDDNLLASGILMEAYSDDISFNIYVFNVENSITIDYKTGNNYTN